MAALAEGQFPDAAARDAMRAVGGGQRFVGHRVLRVQERGGVHGARPGVGHLQREAVGEALLRLRLQGVIPGVADRIEVSDVAELRIGQQQRAAGHGGAGVLRIQSEERAGELRAKVVDGGRVTQRQAAEVRRRNVVDVAAHAQVRGAAADVGGFDDEAAAQLPLEAERPALRVGRFAVRGVVADGLAEVGGETAGGAERRQQPVGQRIRQLHREGEAVVAGGLHGRGLAEAGQVAGGGVGADVAVEDAIAGADDGLIVPLIGHADARHEHQTVAAPEVARSAVDAGEGESAVDLEVGRRELGNRILGVVGDGLRRDGVRHVDRGKWWRSD